MQFLDKIGNKLPIDTGTVQQTTFGDVISVRIGSNTRL